MKNKQGGNCFMNNKLIKILGIGATVLGIAASLITKMVDDKALDRKISEEVAKALAEKSVKIES